MPMRKKAVNLLCAIFLLATIPAALRAQESFDPLIIGYPSISAVNAPLWVGQDAGIFRKHGLNTQLIFILGGVRIIQGVVSGALHVGWGGGPATLSAILSGADLKVIAALNEIIAVQIG